MVALDNGWVGERAACETGKPVEDGRTPLLEVREKAARISSEGLLLREQPRQILVLLLDRPDVALQVTDLSTQAVHRRRKSSRLVGLDLGHEGGKLPLLEFGQRARQLPTLAEDLVGFDFPSSSS